MSSLIRLVYAPEGASRQEWEIDLQNPAWDITYATEKATGWAWDEFCDRIAKHSAVALQALLWTLRKRDQRSLQLGSVHVLFSECWLEDPDLDGDAEVPAPEGDAEVPKETD